MITNFAAATDFLYTLPNFSRQGRAAYEPGLERTILILKALGNPQRYFPSVHIAGTNGKGSTASMVAAIATASGRRVGLHTSPHLFHLCERLRIDGLPASEDWIVDALQRYGDVLTRLGASFFEAMVALSFLYFREEEVDLAVVEVGMGGRLDATNVLQPDIAVITRIGFDHTDVLGDTIIEIATEKGGIIKSGIPVVCGMQESEALSVLRTIAMDRKAAFYAVEEEVDVEVLGRRTDGSLLTIRTPENTYSDIFLDLAGQHQVQNAATAVRTTELLLPRDPPRVPYITRALGQVRTLSGLRGRLDVCREEPFVVLDVGHNSEGLQVALRFMSEILSPRLGHLYVAFGTMRDKDILSMARQLATYRARVFVLPAGTERAFPPDETARYLQAADVETEIVNDASEVLDRFYARARSNDGLLVTGSHYIASQFDALAV